MPRTTPQVSIVVPAYRTRELAVRAVRSALGQVGVDIEVIAVDDASGDGTAELLRGLDDPRLRVLEQPANRGPSAARNRALDAARGEWVALLDSDDWYASDRCARLLHVAQSGQIDLVADDLWLVPYGATTPSGTLFAGRLREPREFDTASFVRASFPGRSTLALGLTRPIVRRQLLERHALRYDERFRYTEDFHFYVRCLLAGGRFVAVPDVYYFYTCGRPSAATAGDRLRNVRQALIVNDALLGSPALCDPRVRNALILRRRALRDDVAIQSVLEPFLAGDIAMACWRAVTVPRVIPAVLRRIPDVLGRRPRAWPRGTGGVRS